MPIYGKWYNLRVNTEKKKMGKITLYIEEELIENAKVAAIRAKTSVSSEVESFLRQWVQNPTKTPRPSMTTETKAEYKTDPDPT